MSKNSNTRNNIIHHVMSMTGPLIAFHMTVAVLLIASFQPWVTGLCKALVSTIVKLLTPPHK